MSYQRFAKFEPIRHDWPCHAVKMNECVSSIMKGLYGTYNATNHILQRYQQPLTVDMDTGDYFACRILQALHLLVSQGKEEKVTKVF